MTIGTPVLVSAVLQKDRETNGDLHWTRFEASLRGIVTGRGFRCEGQFHKASGGGTTLLGYDEDYEPAYLAVTRRIPVVFVRFGLWSKEHPVLPEDVSPAPADDWTLPARARVRV